MPSVSAAVMGKVDQLAVNEFGIDILQMMEQAGSHLAELVREEIGGDLRGRRIIVAVGPGNNGGGGLAAAPPPPNPGGAGRGILPPPGSRVSGAGRPPLP